MGVTEDYIRRRLRRAISGMDVCGRCGTTFVIRENDNPADDCRCFICGMDVEAEGPPKPWQIEGIIVGVVDDR